MTERRRWAMPSALAALIATAAACAEGSGPGPRSSGGTAGRDEPTAGAAGGGGASGSASGGAAGGGAAGASAGTSGRETCDERPSAERPQGVMAAAHVVPTIDGKPASLDEQATLPDGTKVRLSTLRFYVSDPAFVDRDGRAIPTDLVDAGGSPLPYRVQLVDLDDPASTTLRLRATPGGYAGVRLTIGLSAACNHMNPATATGPLAASSGMTWVWMWGYVQVKVEGKRAVSGADAWESFAAHGGSIPTSLLAPTKTAPGSIELPAATELDLELELGAALAAVKSSVDLGGGVELMEFLRDPAADVLRLGRP